MSHRRGNLIRKGGQGLGHFGGPLEAQAAVLGNHPIDDPREAWGNFWTDLGERRWHLLAVGLEFLDKGPIGKGRVSGEQVVECAPETINIGLDVGRRGAEACSGAM